jgi:hypothetical protein
VRGPLIAGVRPLPAHVERSIVRALDGCWWWAGCVSADGYGKVTVDYRKWLAHRFTYAWFIGPVPDGRELHHRCENRQCVNPAHLVAVTREEHIALTPQFRERQRSTALARTHCRHGHAYTTANTAIARDGSRVCRACKRITGRRCRGNSNSSPRLLRARSVKRWGGA